jgi:hypothetical protein
MRPSSEAKVPPCPRTAKRAAREGPLPARGDHRRATAWRPPACHRQSRLASRSSYFRRPTGYEPLVTKCWESRHRRRKLPMLDRPQCDPRQPIVATLPARAYLQFNPPGADIHFRSVAIPSKLVPEPGESHRNPYVHECANGLLTATYLTDDLRATVNSSGEADDINRSAWPPGAGRSGGGIGGVGRVALLGQLDELDQR